MEDTQQFENRKRNHLNLALQGRNQTPELMCIDRIELVHEALPDLNFQDISLQTILLGQPQALPFFVSSMTAGHPEAQTLNIVLAEACQELGWAMGIGSQRRQLFDSKAGTEWANFRKRVPRLKLFGNIGIAQAIQTSTHKVQELVDSIEANAMIIHLNPLQECLQPEGTPQFLGSIKTLEKLVKELKCPVIVKETGCGMSLSTIKHLVQIGVHVIDVSGTGGTHWGRIEGHRSQPGSMLALASRTFENWGISTISSLIEAQKLEKWGNQTRLEIWASGGIRNGLDSAKFIGLGAKMVGFAKSALENAVKGEEPLREWMKRIEFELRIAMFCTGSQKLENLREKVRYVCP